MDFIAEMVLGYIDGELIKKTDENKIYNYKILRYRDDYRIFFNDKNHGAIILRILVEILKPFGLKLNSSKTSKTNLEQNIILSSIKEDKLAWLNNDFKNLVNLTLEKRLLIIKLHSVEYPNSGSLTKALTQFHKLIEFKLKNNNLESLQKFVKQMKKYARQNIALVVDIAFHNPKVIVSCCGIISQFLSVLNMDKKKSIAQKVFEKLKKIPNSNYLQIWLQRALSDLIADDLYSEILCKLISSNQNSLWENDFISAHDNISSEQKDSLIKIIKQTEIFDKEKFDNLKNEIMKNDEISLFGYNY